MSTASQLQPRGSILAFESGTIASFPVVSLLSQKMSPLEDFILDGAVHQI